MGLHDLEAKDRKICLYKMLIYLSMCLYVRFVTSKVCEVMHKIKTHFMCVFLAMTSMYYLNLVTMDEMSLIYL